MTNREVAQAFSKGKAGKSLHMSTDGEKVWSYWALIAFKEKGKILIIDRAYSSTTGRHMSHVGKVTGEQVAPYTKTEKSDKNQSGYGTIYQMKIHGKYENSYHDRFCIHNER